MYNIKDYLNPYHGMEWSAGFDPKIRDNENGIYFLVHYYIFKHIQNTLTQQDRIDFIKIVEAIKTYHSDGKTQYKGLFDRGSKESINVPKDQLRTISHDNLSAIVVGSIIFDLDYHKDIFKHGKSNFWRFDNVYPEKPRWGRMMLPRDISMWSILGGGVLAKLLGYIYLPIFYFEQIFSCSRTMVYRPQLIERIFGFFKTGKLEKPTWSNFNCSGKMLAFLRLYGMKKKKVLGASLAWWSCNKIVEKKWQGGMAWVYYWYFARIGLPWKPIEITDKSHPLVVEAKKVF